jgi:hypothetical protein
VDLVVGAERDEEAGVAAPAEEHPQVVVDAERPVVRLLALELVRPEERILGIVLEASQGRSKHQVARRLQLPRAPQETGGGRRVPSDVLGLSLADLAQEQGATRRAQLLALGLVAPGVDEVRGRL